MTFITHDGGIGWSRFTDVGGHVASGIFNVDIPVFINKMKSAESEAKVCTDHVNAMLLLLLLLQVQSTKNIINDLCVNIVTVQMCVKLMQL